MSEVWGFRMLDVWNVEQGMSPERWMLVYNIPKYYTKYSMQPQEAQRIWLIKQVSFICHKPKD